MNQTSHDNVESKNSSLDWIKEHKLSLNNLIEAKIESDKES